MIALALPEVLKMKHPGTRLLIGIDGMSGAGKTTLVGAIRGELQGRGHQTAVLHLDDLIVDRSTRYNTGFEEWYEHYGIQWDVARIAENVLLGWKRGDSQLELDVYDGANDTVHRQQMDVPQDGILLIEGVYLQRKEWRDFFDYVLYLDCPRGVRMERVSKRSGQDVHDPERIELYKRRYWAAEDHYLAAEIPLQRADLVLKSTESSVFKIQLSPCPAFFV